MNILKRKNIQEEETNNDNWWKDPRLDDEGTYDYLIIDVPEDSIKFNWYYEKCDSCGKEHYLNRTMTHYFRTLDGYDADSYTECIKCIVKGDVHRIKMKIKNKIKAFLNSVKDATSIAFGVKTGLSFKTKIKIWKAYYRTMMKIHN